MHFFKNSRFWPLWCSSFLHAAILVWFLYVGTSLQKEKNLFFKKAPETLRVHLLPQLKRKQVVKTHVGKKTKPIKSAFLSDQNRRVSKETSTTKITPDQKPSFQGFGLTLFPPSKKTNTGLKKQALLKKNHPSPFAKKASQKASRPKRPHVLSAKRYEDYVKGLRPGEQTALNTQEFVFFHYFERIRSQLDQAWKPILKDKLIRMFRKGRFLASQEEYSTQTIVVLNQEGQVIRVEVLESSQKRVLDQAAVEAFNQAGPFPHPPKGLLNKKGEVEIHWEFLLKT